MIGLNVTMSNYEDSNGAEFSGTWTSLFEIHSYVDLTLEAATVDVGQRRGPLRLDSRFRIHTRRGAAIVLAAGIGAPGQVGLYDVIGRRVTTLHSGWVPPEGVRCSWAGRGDDGGDAPDGVYWLRAQVAGRHFVRKFTYLR